MTVQEYIGSRPVAEPMEQGPASRIESKPARAHQRFGQVVLDQGRDHERSAHLDRRMAAPEEFLEVIA